MVKTILTALTLLAVPSAALASSGSGETIVLTGSYFGYLSIAIFVAAYSLVPLENILHMRKSKPVLMAAGIIWILVALAYRDLGVPERAHDAIKHGLVEYAELFLFLLAAMTYINALEERNVFQALRAFLVSRGFSLRQVFWITGVLSFVISPIADNLTTALLMGAVVMAVGGKDRKFVALACINVVVAANAGGAFSPFGDITTLMVWQKEKVTFVQFFMIFIPSVVNWLVPALIMNFAITDGTPQASEEHVALKFGAKVMMALFVATIVTAVSFHNFLQLPPAAGMMLGLGYLGMFSFYVKKQEGRIHLYDSILGARADESLNPLRLLRRYGKDIGRYLESLPYPAFMINTEHTIIHWNSGLEKLTGLAADEMIGTKMQWKPFYQEPRPALADLVLDGEANVEIRKRYRGLHRNNPIADKAFDAANYFENVGESGRYLMFIAAPVTDEKGTVIGAVEMFEDMTEHRQQVQYFDVMERIARAEWDTLLFFYGIILCVAGLGQFGYLALISEFMYTDLGPTIANTLVGVLSAIVDNIPVMFAVLTMDPTMSLGQWQLVTLTAGVGGSMLAIGSAAGVALLGTARGIYTFGAHLKWTPVIALGYVLSIFCHLWLNAHVM